MKSVAHHFFDSLKPIVIYTLDLKLQREWQYVIQEVGALVWENDT